MKIGLQIPNFTWPGGPAEIAPRLAQIARTADDLGFASLWVMDHFFQIPRVGALEEPMLESYTTLGFLSAHTRRARLGALVTGVVYRHPGILVKAVSTLDVLSGGRAYFGVGAAWNEVEARGLGIPFPPIKDRFQRLEETLQIAHQMWSGDRAGYTGRHYQLADPLNSPQPLTKPHPPILIGGMGEQKTLRLVARYGDACNFFASAGPEALAHKLDLLKRYCAEENRSYEAIEKTALSGMGDFTPAAVAGLVELCRSLGSLGFSHLIVNLKNVSEIVPLETIGRDVIPQVAGL